MRSETYFATHPVFTLEEFAAARPAGERSRNTTKNLLAKHVAAGRIQRVRRGLYAAVAPGLRPEEAPLDPYLLASKLADDAVIAYHAAVQFYGKSYSVWRRFHYLTDHRLRPLVVRGDEFVPVPTPATLRYRRDRGGAIERIAHAGGSVRVTTLERCLVDVLDAPERCGGWEEAWRSLELIEFFDLDQVVDYALRLGSAVTIARVGVYLDQHRDELMVDGAHLSELRRARPRQPRYFDAARTPGRLMHEWNLIVPDEILERRWEETP
jgi:predicted transcriptional regulator of viral defense system